MKITNSTKSVELQQSNANAPARKPEGAAAGATGGVRLSDLSAKMHDLEARLSSEPAFDADRVNQLKDAIRTGDFKVNASAVADGLIASVQDSLAKPRV